MPACEKCWRDAGGDANEYARLLAVRTPCAPVDQCGKFHHLMVFKNGATGKLYAKCACGMRTGPADACATHGVYVGTYCKECVREG